MNRERPLHGGCSCGRNKYTILIPHNSIEVPRVFFDQSHSHRRSQATPLSAFLRIPLSWYQSTTYAFLADETHTSIRRVYTSPSEQSTKRHFCGFCGTPLSYWSEDPPEEAGFISLTLCSLGGEELRDLEELGWLPEDMGAGEEGGGEGQGVGVESLVPAGEGLPWFETMVEGSKLGKMRRSRGSKTGDGGRYRVEWEVIEWTDEANEGEGAEAAPGKRKLRDVEGEGGEEMEGIRSEE